MLKRTLAVLLLPVALGGCADTTMVLNGDEQYVRASYLEEHSRTSEARTAYADSVDYSLDPRDKRRSLSALADLNDRTGHSAGPPPSSVLREEAALLGDRRSINELARQQYDNNVRPRRLAELIPFYERSARESSNSTALLLGRMTEQGELGGSPGTSAADWYTIAAERGSNTAKKELVVLYARTGDDGKAMSWIGRLDGTERTQMYLAIAKDFLDGGDRLPRNGDAAVRWYRRGLAANPTEAVRSANRFLTDAPSDTDRTAILGAIRPLADKGNPDAAMVIARALDQQGSEVNPDAVRYYIVAARGGNEDAFQGLMKSAAFLKSDDPLSGQIVSSLETMGQRGNVDAMLTLGNSYGVGTLVGRDPGKSFDWYLRAAKAGSAEAQYRTGLAYADGIGTRKDLGEAKLWLQASAKAGFSLAPPALDRLNAAKP